MYLFNYMGFSMYRALFLLFSLAFTTPSAMASTMSESLFNENLERLAKVKRIDDKINMEYRQFISPEFAQNFQEEENLAYKMMTSAAQSMLDEYALFGMNSLFNILDARPDLNVFDGKEFMKFAFGRLAAFSEDRFTNASLLWDLKIRQMLALRRGVELSPLSKYQMKVLQDRYDWILKASTTMIDMIESLNPQSLARKVWFEDTQVNLELGADFYEKNSHHLDLIENLNVGLIPDEHFHLSDFFIHQLKSKVRSDLKDPFVQWSIGNLFSFKIPVDAEIFSTHHQSAFVSVDRLGFRISDKGTNFYTLNVLNTSCITFCTFGISYSSFGNVEEIKKRIENEINLMKNTVPEDDFLPDHLKKKGSEVKLKKITPQKPKAASKKALSKKTKKVVKPKAAGKPKAVAIKVQEEQKPMDLPQPIQLPKPIVAPAVAAPAPLPVEVPAVVEEEPMVPEWLAYKHAKLNPKGERERRRQNRMVDATKEPQVIENLLTYQLKPKDQLLLNQMIAGKLEQKVRWEDGLNLVRKLIKQVGGKISTKKGNGSAVTISIGDVSFLVHASHGFGPDMYPDQVRYLANGLMHAGIALKE